MKKILLLTVVSIFLVAQPASATFFGFTTNPATNSVDWTNAILGLGGSVNSNVNFDTHPLGLLQSGFYSVSDGLTLTPSSSDVSTVSFGAGPGQGNTSSTPKSSGEGLHGASNFLFDGRAVSSLTLSFDQPVLGGGLFIIDYFNPSGSNPLNISAFDGPNGTGNLLGTASSVAFNFQKNNKYFMGVASTDNDIRSIIYRDLSTSTGDTTGIDDILFGLRSGDPDPRPQPNVIPEPSSIFLLSTGLLAFARRRRS